VRIAIITEFAASPGNGFYGGVDSRVISMGRELGKRHEVHIITSLQPGQERTEDHGGVQVHRIGRPRPFVQRGSLLSRWEFNRECVKEIARLKPDVVEGSGFVSYLGSYRSGIKIGRPKMVTVHEVWQGEWTQNMGLINGAIGTILEKAYLRNPFDRYITVSEFTKAKLAEVGIDPGRISVINSGIDRSIFAGMAPEKFSAPTILSICRLVPYKKVDMLIRAVAALRTKYPDIRLLVVGKGPEEAPLRQLVQDLGLSRNVEFLGKVATTEEIVRLLKRSHVFALPSIVEGFGLVVVEAMAAGTPWVASDLLPIREATGGGLGGRLFRPLDLDDLVRALDETLEQGVAPDPRIEALVEHYDWSNLARQYERETALLVEGGDASRPGPDRSPAHDMVSATVLTSRQRR